MTLSIGETYISAQPVAESVSSTSVASRKEAGASEQREGAEGGSCQCMGDLRATRDGFLDLGAAFDHALLDVPVPVCAIGQAGAVAGRV